MMKNCLLATFIAAGASSVDARRCGGLSCSRYGGDYNGYNHRRQRRPTSAIDLVSDMFSVPFYNTNALLRQQHDQLARLKQNSAPRYSISESDDGKSFELSMEVPGVAASDLAIEVENNNLLHVRGIRTIRESGSISKTEFDQSFHLEDIDIERISVSLSNGILTVLAPKKDPVVKRIPLKIEEVSHISSDVEIKKTHGMKSEDKGHNEEDEEDEELTITTDEEI